MAYRSASWFASLLWMWSVLLSTVSCQSQFGTRFIIAIPYAKANGTGTADSSSDFRLVLTSGSTNAISVQRQQDDVLQFPIDIAGLASASVTLAPGTNHMLSAVQGTSSSRTSVLFTTNPSEQFAVQVHGTKAYDGYTAIPVASWGTEYVVATHCRGPGSVCQIVILAQ